MQGQVPSAHRLCFLPLANAPEALAGLQGTFDCVDAEVELVVHALAVRRRRGGCSTAGVWAGCALLAVSFTVVTSITLAYRPAAGSVAWKWQRS